MKKPIHRILAALAGLLILAGELYVIYLWATAFAAGKIEIDTRSGFRVGPIPIPLEAIMYMILFALTMVPSVWGVRLFAYSFKKNVRRY
jgi:hypothetical protein